MRPLGPRAEKTRAKILEAAERAFAERGYEATRLLDIADRAGVRRASMVYYFPDKEALYGALLDGLFGALFLRASALFAQPLPFETRLLRMVEAWVDFAWDRPAIARILMREIADATPSARPQILRFTKPFFDLVRAGIPEAVGAGPDRTVRLVDVLHFVSAVAGTTAFFICAMPALDPSLYEQAHAQDAREALRTRMIELARGLVASNARVQEADKSGTEAADESASAPS